jgi:hypothetical protein
MHPPRPRAEEESAAPVALVIEAVRAFTQQWHDEIPAEREARRRRIIERLDAERQKQQTEPEEAVRELLEGSEAEKPEPEESEGRS